MLLAFYIAEAQTLSTNLPTSMYLFNSFIYIISNHYFDQCEQLREI